MAGDWLKMGVDLPEKPEVWQIAGMVGIDADAVVGKLLKVWRWFDAHTRDGQATGVGFALVDRLAGQTGFGEAMALCGWLHQDGSTLQCPGFDKHNGKTAKDRADTARRVAKCKEAKSNEKGNRNVLPRPLVNAVRERDNATCRYCGRVEGQYSMREVPADGRMHIDHVIPVSRGGSDALENLVCACSVCNMHKSNRTPEECGLPWPTDELGNRFGNKVSLPNALAREEKRREENKDTPIVPKGDESADSGFDGLLAAYHAILPNCQRVTVVTDKRRRTFRNAVKLAKRVCRERGWDYGDDFWRDYFAECAKDPWRRGEVANPNNAAWRQSIDVLLRDDQFAKVMDSALGGGQ